MSCHTVAQLREASGVSGASVIAFRGGEAGRDPGAVHEAAAQGLTGSAGRLPHLDAVQASFGRHDVSGVKAHVGGPAREATEAMGAEAYATGDSVAFRRSPDVHTAAHEAAHVVQQRAGIHLSGGVGRSGDAHERHADAVADRVVQGRSAEDLLNRYVAPAASLQMKRAPVQMTRNPRFDQDQEIADAEAETDYIQKGDSGRSVRLIQQGLIDAGHDLPGGVTGTFNQETEDAVKAFQREQGIDDDGVVGPDTMGALNTVHNRHETVVDIARGQDPANPTEGTRALDPSEVSDYNDAISTAPRTASGGLPTFQQTRPDGDYEARIRARMLEIINDFHADFQQQEAARSQPDSLHDWDDIEQVADAAKGEADRVFGSYGTGARPALEEGTNLFDAWEQESDAISSDPDYADFIVEDLAGYFIHNYMDAIHDDHGAVPSRAAEEQILERVKADFVVSHRQELLDIQVSWPGLADGGEISIQLLKADNDADNRDFMWEQFATIIHEYIHTLEHPDHVAYRGTMDEDAGSLTLREGMCDYFTKMVWDTIEFTPALNSQVEGPFHNPNMQHNIPTPTFYDSTEQAERAVGVVGVRNAMAAFFLGRVDLIGGP